MVIAIVAIFGWTYKLNRDLKSDLREEMAKNQREMLERLGSHIHDDRSGEVLLRALANH